MTEALPLQHLHQEVYLAVLMYQETTFTPSASNIGLNIISYEYTANGCAPITVTQDLQLMNLLVVLPINVTTNPIMFGDCDGTAIITATLGLPPYIMIGELLTHQPFAQVLFITLLLTETIVLSQIM